MPVSPHRSVRVPVIIAILTIGQCGTVALAGNDYPQNFSLRLPPAFIRLRDVATMGGETVANRFSSALNPACADWTTVPSKFGVVLVPYNSTLCFDAGARIHVWGEAINWDTRDWGTFQPTVSQIYSNEAVNRMGLIFDYHVNSVQLLWAKRFGDCAFGASVNVAHAEVIHRFGATGVKLSESNSESYRIRLGGLWEPAEKWLTGLAIEYGVAPFRSKTFLPGPGGTITVYRNDAADQLIVRPGISYEYAQYCTVYFDYQYGYFAQAEFGALNSHRFTLGIDHRLLEFLFVRGSVSADVRGNVGFTVGVSLHLAEWLSFDAGYQYDQYPELHQEFGRSNGFQAVLAVRI